jgi:hypothetical protein
VGEVFGRFLGSFWRFFGFRGWELRFLLLVSGREVFEGVIVGDMTCHFVSRFCSFKQCAELGVSSAVAEIRRSVGLKLVS